MKHFLDLSLIDKKELRQIVENSKTRKKNRNNKGKVLVDKDNPLEGKMYLWFLKNHQQEQDFLLI